MLLDILRSSQFLNFISVEALVGPFVEWPEDSSILIFLFMGSEILVEIGYSLRESLRIDFLDVLHEFLFHVQGSLASQNHGEHTYGVP